MAITVTVAGAAHLHFSEQICAMLFESAKERGTGIARRNPPYIREKMSEGKAIIALDGEILVGFCYIEDWDNKLYVANSGLIVNKAYRGTGVAKQIKSKAFALSRKLFPEAKLFGITTSQAVLKINFNLGFRPVTFGELTQDEKFWAGCQSCPNYDILQRNQKRMCLCTGMLYDPKEKQKKKFQFKAEAFEYFRQFKLEKLMPKAKKPTEELKR